MLENVLVSTTFVSVQKLLRWAIRLLFVASRKLMSKSMPGKPDACCALANRVTSCSDVIWLFARQTTFGGIFVPSGTNCVELGTTSVTRPLSTYLNRYVLST